MLVLEGGGDFLKRLVFGSSLTTIHADHDEDGNMIIVAERDPQVLSAIKSFDERVKAVVGFKRSLVIVMYPERNLVKVNISRLENGVMI